MVLTVPTSSVQSIHRFGAGRSRELVVLGHPLDYALVPVPIAVDRIPADRLEVDEPVADRASRMVTELVTRRGDRRHEPCPAGEPIR
jgi:hypothetical protein